METIILSISIILLVVYIIDKPSNFLYKILVFNILIDTITGFVDPGESAQNFYLAIARAIIIILFLVSTFNYYKIILLKEFLIVFIFLSLISFLTIFSSDIVISISGTLKVILTYMMLPIGFYFINTKEKIDKLNNSMFWVITIVVINFIIANIFNIGRTSYSSVDEFYAGGFHIGALNSLALCVILVFFIYDSISSSKRKLLYIAAPLLLIFLVISMKRAPILAGSIGIIIYFWFTKAKGRVFKVISVIILFITLTFPFYEDILFEQIYAREKQLQLSNLNQESRYKEIFIVYDEILNAPNLITILFGKEIFNTVGHYANGTFGRRELHTDFGLILNGSGIVGLMLFVSIYILIFVKFNKLSDKVLNNNSMFQFYHKLKTVFYALFAAGLLITTIEGLLAVTYRSILFLYLGSILGCYYKLHYLPLKFESEIKRR